MTAPDLKPCPFCGGQAVYDFHAKGMPGAWENDCDHWIYCEAEDCFANVGLCESKAEAITAWNTRPTPLAEEAFMSAVWDALKADASDLRKQQRILKAFHAALRAIGGAK